MQKYVSYYESGVGRNLKKKKLNFTFIMYHVDIIRKKEVKCNKRKIWTQTTFIITGTYSEKDRSSKREGTYDLYCSATLVFLTIEPLLASRVSVAGKQTPASVHAPITTTNVGDPTTQLAILF